ncbi:MAG: amino acid adenylation domain-containing protein [Deltaproteobacteria bacterium]|nr:amino acid adenylation domain-containing protein [Deltaproteobacteria bacterium]
MTKKKSLDMKTLNNTARKYPLDKPIQCFIEEQCAKTPNHIAITFEGTSVTYEVMNQRVNRLAHYLAANGVKKETLVGVYMERSIEMVISLHAIVKSGGAYVPIDPDYPDDRIAFMAEDADIDILLTQTHLVEKYPGDTKKVVCLDKTEHIKEIEACSAENPPLVSTPDSLCYMIYTSGSTGKPKGVPNIHKALVNRLFWQQDALGLTEDDVCIQKTPYSFDVSVWEFFWPFMFGASLVVARPGGHKEAEYLADTIIRNKVTTIHFVPSMLSLFLTAENLGGIQSLKRVVCSGEALPYELTRKFFELLPSSELHNLYGPTEAAIDVTHWQCQKDSKDNVVPIGFPIANIQLYILDEELNQVPFGETGELHIGGVGLARGYWKREELTKEKFISNPFSKKKSDRLYKTGDLARYREDGSIEFLGRIDFQVKIRGLRIELQEIEAVLLKHDAISEAAVVATDNSFAEKQLVAFVVVASDASRPAVDTLRTFLLEWLPDYMVPARFVYLDTMPLSPNGKIDRKSLRFDENERPELSAMYIAPKTTLQKELVNIWSDVLHLNKVGINDNFFELGGNSLLVVNAATRISDHIGKQVKVVKLFQHPTVAALAEALEDTGKGAQAFLDEAFERATRSRIGRFTDDASHDGVAVVGMAGRFPGARNLNELWANLCNKVESITRFSMDELGPGIEESILNHPNYVPSRGIIEDADKFDAKFFGVSPLEAKSMDPQQRVMLELAWTALENAGYAPDKFPGHIGVFAGVGDNHYYHRNVLCHPDVVENVGHVIVGYGNEKDYIATRVSYQLDLTGPSVSANTGCSTSLLAVDHAFKCLIDYECDMAIAGGVDIYVPQKSGQVYREGGTFTRDGHCRPFDAEASGTMFCDGAGLVVLKRLEDAIRDGDQVYAVIRGSAKNNDGARKVSFLAPSVDGQARVVAQAQAQANVHPEQIGYHEAHGTGTPLGDPIEVEALVRAFGAQTSKTEYCHLSSLKGNIGHPTIASGVAGLIKVALALHNEKIPPVLHYQKPNPKIDFSQTPFKVVQDLTEWPRGKHPRFASVSSFGFGGTNVHAVLQEAPVQEVSGPSRKTQLLRFSGKTENALARNRKELGEFLEMHQDTNLADAAFTLDRGRVHHKYRDFVVCTSAEQAAEQLSKIKRVTGSLETLEPDVVFMFPGQGAQYVNMGRTLYDVEPVFRDAMNRCFEILQSHLDKDLKGILFPTTGDAKDAAEILKDTTYTQPAIFTIEYSLARLWIHWGLKPSVMIGHSIGEFVCACLAEVMTLEDALAIVALRGRLMGGLPRGSMLSVRVAATEIEQRLPAEIQLAASNSPGLSVVAGPPDAIAAFAEKLDSEGISTTLLHTSHAFHSEMMAPIVDPFKEAVEKVTRNAPTIPFVSTCTGDWITDEDAVSSEYWARHLRMPVRFSEAVSKLLDDTGRVFLELGPRNVLTILTRQHMDGAARTRVIPSLGGSPDDNEEWNTLLTAVGDLWKNGVDVDAARFYQGQHRRRIPLPTYSFERKSYWLQPKLADYHGIAAAAEDEDESLEAASSGGEELTLEQKFLLRLWREVLGVDELTIDDDFFDLGGHSLVGITMVDKINGQFDSNFILSDIINNPTIRQFSVELAALNGDTGDKESRKEKKEKEWTPLVALSAKGNTPPVFCVAGHGGHVMELHQLSQGMSPDIPFYGLETRGVAGHTPFETIEEIAADNINAIRQRQPNGPYFIAGYSFGGTIAYEIAQQLVAQGEKVAWLGLIDAQSPTLPMRNKLDLRRAQVMRLIHLRRTYLKKWVNRILEPAPEVDERYLAVEKATEIAEKKYKPKVFQGDATLFRVPKDVLIYDVDYTVQFDAYEGWRDLILGQIEVIPVRGGHVSLVTEQSNALYLAKRMKENLAEVYKRMKLA